MKRLVLLAGASLVAVLAVLAAPALSTRPWVPEAVDFELAPPQASAAASGRGVVSPPLKAPKRFNLVGLRWSRGGEVAVAIRTRRDGGRWTPWTAVPTRGDHAPDAGAERSRGQGTEPVWVGHADWVQYRLSRPVRGLRLHFVNSTGTATPAQRVTTALRRAASRAAVAVGGLFSARAQGDPGIVPRADWGADESCKPRRKPSYGRVKAAFVHHTVSTNGYSREEAPSVVLAICRYHRNSNGWDDIGYNFLVDRYGTIYEGRAGGIDKAVVGAQAQGFNAESTGVAAIGRHDVHRDGAPPTSAMVDALARVIGWKLSLHGQPTDGTVVLTSAGGSANRWKKGTKVRLPRVSGHRDGNHTTCPGDYLYDQLDAIRAKAAGANAARTKLQVHVSARVLRFPEEVVISGRLALMKGQPVANQPVEIQALKGKTWKRVAGATTDGDGSFEARIAPGGNNTFRVRYPGGPELRAATSKRTTVRVRPRITARRSVSRALVGQTPIVSGRIEPRRKALELVVQRRIGSRNVLVARERLTARGGRFRKGVRVTAPGLWRFYVRFRADEKNLGATSEPFYIRVLPPGTEGGGTEAG